jgi:outer membrane protein assembly factor BamB
MYIGSLPPASNRATYQQDFQIYDDEDDEGVDLTGAAITVELRRPDCASGELTATTANGKVVVTDTDEGQFELTFTVSDMRNLDPMTYECGITIVQNDETTQFFIGTLAVLDGIVS